MSNNDGFTELHNEDGTLFGFVFEPDASELLVQKAWLAESGVPDFAHRIFSQWNSYIAENPNNKDFAPRISSQGENHPVAINYRGNSVT